MTYFRGAFGDLLDTPRDDNSTYDALADARAGLTNQRAAVTFQWRSGASVVCGRYRRPRRLRDYILARGNTVGHYEHHPSKDHTHEQESPVRRDTVVLVERSEERARRER